MGKNKGCRNCDSPCSSYVSTIARKKARPLQYHPRRQCRKDIYTARREEAGVRRSRLFKSAYQALAFEKGCWFLDAGEITKTDSADGLHITGESHRSLGQAAAAAVPGIL